MKTTRVWKVFAIAVLMPMLIMAFAAAPVQAKSPECKYVDTNKVCADVPVCEGSLHIEGMYHVNLIATEKQCNWDIKLHVDWHGEIVLYGGCGCPILTIDSKNVQLVVHASIPECNPCQADIFVNFHTNTQVYINGCPCDREIDLKMHIILDIDNGCVDKFKVQLPDFCDAPII